MLVTDSGMVISVMPMHPQKALTPIFVTVSGKDSQNTEVYETTVGASYEAEYYGSVIGPSVNLINNISNLIYIHLR